MSGSVIDTLLAKVGTPQPIQAGVSGNGRYLLCEALVGDKVTRVMVEANCPAERVEQAVEAALAVLARGRGA